MKLGWSMGLVAAAVLAAVGAAALPAAQSVNVEQKSLGDFQGGTFEDAVVNNLGELRLAHKLDLLVKADKDVAFVNALAVDDQGNLFAATGPNGKLLRITPAGAVEVYYTAKEKTLQSLAIGPKGELYVGTGGGEGRIYRVTGKDKAEAVFEKAGLAYVWSMAVLPDGRLVAGTGPHAELILLNPDEAKGKGEKPSAGEVLFKPEKDKQKNILAVAAGDGGKVIYFGTDTEGLVFKYDLGTRKPFLMFDSEESEVSALAVGPDGVLYAGTSDPRLAGEGGGRGGMDLPLPIHGRPSGDTPQTGPQSPGDDSSEDLPDDSDGGDSTPIEAGAPGAAPTIIRMPAIYSAGAEAEAARPALTRAGISDKWAMASQAVARRMPLAAAASPPPASQPGGSRSAARPVSPPAKQDVKLPASQPAAGGAGKPAGAAFGPSTEPTNRMREMMAGRGGRPSGGESGGAGNAVYRIDANGFVTEIVRQPTMMLSLLVQGNRVIVGTGSDGRVLAVTPGSDEIVTLAKPKDVKQIMALAPGRGGTVYIGSANAAIVGRIGAGFSQKGTFAGKPIDAKQISRWGVVREQSKPGSPAGTVVRVQTRSGNLAEPEDSLWSPWSEPVEASEPVAIGSPAARFIQYRVVLTSEKPDATPVVTGITLSYANENQPPKLLSVRAVPAGGVAGESDEGGPGPMPSGRGSMPPMSLRRPSGGSGGPMMRSGGEGDEGPLPSGFVTVTWKAADPNDDPLEFMLYFRQVGKQAWAPMFEKPIRDARYRWSTRGVPDGQYQVKVVASDLPGNPAAQAKDDSRISTPLVVDNTPPVINNFRVVEKNGAKVTLAADTTDALTRLAGAEVKIDSAAADGQMLQPIDGIWDQRTESLKFTVDLSGKPAGAHLLILTVTDGANNSAAASLEVVKP